MPARAAKWRHCPDHLGYYPSRLGAVSAPFIHPNRELGIFLTASDVGASGGFSTEPDGNVVHIRFESLFGDPIDVPPRSAAAVSSSTLYFEFPDTLADLGRRLAGPVSVTVTTGGVVTAEIISRHLVALPPSNNVGGLVAGSTAQMALATMDARGAIWIPVEFSAYGTMQKPMMMCPGTFIPLTAFTVGVTVRSQPSFVEGAPPSYPPFRALRKVDVFLGDFLINGFDYYGIPVGNLPVLRIPRGWGIRVCGVNDAVDLVLRARGWGRWARPWSPFRTWMPDSQPLEIDLSQLGSGTGSLDAFGEECLLQ